MKSEPRVELRHLSNLVSTLGELHPKDRELLLSPKWSKKRSIIFFRTTAVGHCCGGRRMNGGENPVSIRCCRALTKTMSLFILGIGRRTDIGGGVWLAVHRSRSMLRCPWAKMTWNKAIDLQRSWKPRHLNGQGQLMGGGPTLNLILRGSSS